MPEHKNLLDAARRHHEYEGKDYGISHDDEVLELPQSGRPTVLASYVA